MAHRLAPEILNVEQIAIDAGEFFDLESLQADEVTEANLFGGHTLEKQRHFNILCLNLWQEPTKRKILFEDLDISEGRAAICVEEFTKRQSAWIRISAPYKR